MTAMPDTPSLLPLAAKETIQGVMLRPDVTEHFWGFEVRPNAKVFTVGELLRVAAGFASLAAGLAALGVWFVPQMAWSGDMFASKAIVSAVLVMLAVIAGQFAARSARVRVQIDTAKGELREVVDGAVKGPVVLARHGLDIVEAVDVVPSAADPSFGQVQVKLVGIGPVPVGDGDLMALETLRDRIRAACNIVSDEGPRPAIWSGPLAA